jgi:hypothetical protein
MWQSSSVLKVDKAELHSLENQEQTKFEATMQFKIFRLPA